MPVKQITHIDTANSLTVIMRERLGSDALDKPTLFFALREHIKKQTGLGDDLTTRLWMRLSFVANVIQQTVSLTGDDRFDIPAPYASDEDIADFYDFMMARPESVIVFLKAALKLVNAEPDPNPNGAPNEQKPASAPVADSLLVPTN